MAKIALRKHPAEVPGSGLYRTVVVLEVLSDRPVNNIDLMELAAGCRTGDFSGREAELDSREISHQDMAKLLRQQESDPEFLLGPQAWVYGLKKGDQVQWHDPDGKACSQVLTITTISFSGDGRIASITTKEGSELECPVDELQPQE